jgi:hypothetical protein
MGLQTTIVVGSNRSSPQAHLVDERRLYCRGSFGGKKISHGNVAETYIVSAGQMLVAALMLSLL